MRRLMRLAAWLYPAAWRTRYGDEFELLLQDSTPRWSDVLDILKGAFSMQLRSLNFWKIAAAFTVLGTLVACAMSLAARPRYVSTAVIQVQDAHDARQRLQTALSRKALSEIVQREGLYRDERTREPLEDIIVRMRNRDLHTAVSGSTMMVSFAGENAGIAQSTLRDIVTSIGGEVLDPASLPASVTPPRMPMIWRGTLLGLIAGIAIGGVVSLVRGRERFRWARVATFAALGMAVGAAVSLRIPDEYISTAVLRPLDAGGFEERLAEAQQQVLSAESLAKLIERDGLYASQRKSEPVQEVAVNMRNRAIRIRTAGPGALGGHAFTISFQYPEAAKARQVTQELAAQFMTAIPLEVLDPASTPAGPSWPNRTTVALMGVLGGGLLGLAASRVRPRLAAA